MTDNLIRNQFFKIITGFEVNTIAVIRSSLYATILRGRSRYPVVIIIFQISEAEYQPL